MATPPLVSIVMSAYNALSFVCEAIESILNQTFRDFEFLIVNDGSTDGTEAVLARYEKLDKRIRVLSQENRGLISSLNRGCGMARGRYIARMDADDISLPTRLEKQVQHMERHSEIGVLGTWVGVICEKGTLLRTWEVPASPMILMWSLLFRSGLVHPSVIMRRDIITSLGFYRSEALHVEDYDLWARASNVTLLRNLPEILYLYRIWEGSICSVYSKVQEENAVEIVMPLMMRPLLGHDVPPATRLALRQISMNSPITDIFQTVKVAKLIIELHRAYLEKGHLSPPEAREVTQDAGNRLYALASFASRVSLREAFNIYLHGVRLNHSLVSLKKIKKIARHLIRGRHENFNSTD